MNFLLEGTVAKPLGPPSHNIMNEVSVWQYGEYVIVIPDLMSLLNYMYTCIIMT